MKKTIFNVLMILGLLFLGSAELSAQKKGTKQRTSESSGTTTTTTTTSMNTIPKFYIGFGGGLNYQAGIIGLEAEIPLADKFAIDAAGGLGLGRFKASVGANYFFKSVAKGLSANAGFTYASNIFGAESANATQPIETSGLGFEDNDGNPVNFSGPIMWEFNDVPSLDIGLAYNGRLGNKSKFVITFGYSLPFKEAYVLDLGVDNVRLDSVSQTAIDIVAPGGFMLGYKFIFGVG